MLKTVLISTYELGHQPFGLASPAAWLRQSGFEVTCLDMAVEHLLEETVEQADFIAFYLPMHTATQLAIKTIPQIRKISPQAHLCCYGLYAPLNEDYLRRLGISTILGGEFEEGMVQVCLRLQQELQRQAASPQCEPRISLARQRFLIPDRTQLPALSKYAQMYFGNHSSRIVGYVEASRGCKHSCRHCPIVPVYEGRFRIVQKEVVLADIRQQVLAGAEHITFGDADFFNGIGHALSLMNALHEEFPLLTYDVTIKVEHLLQYAQHLPLLKKTGCVMITSAIESIDDQVLSFLQKNHTFEDFLQVRELLQTMELALNPTWIPFTPWTTLQGFRDFLVAIQDLGLIERMAPIQWAIRLLLPVGSKLLTLPEIQEVLGGFNEQSLAYEWQFHEEVLEQFYEEVLWLVKVGLERDQSRQEIFKALWECVNAQLNLPPSLLSLPPIASQTAFPYLNEPWYC